MRITPSLLELFNRKTIREYGGDFGISSQNDINNLEESVNYAANLYGFDDIETICLAAYNITKGHYFRDGNKRTATQVVLKCLKDLDYNYTGRPKDLAEEIIKIAVSIPSEKENSILQFSYFLKHRIQRR